MRLFRNAFMMVIFMSCLGMHECNADLVIIDDKSASAAFSDILAAYVSGDRISDRSYHMGKSVIPKEQDFKDLWETVCYNKCSSSKCGKKSSLGISYKITSDGIQKGELTEENYFDGANCIALCPAKTVSSCKASYAKKYAKEHTDEAIELSVKATDLIVRQAANLATESTFKSDHPDSESLDLETNPEAVSEIHELFNRYVNEISRYLIKALRKSTSR
jgi:hypothetical protein